LARVRVAQRRSLKELGEPVFNSGPLCVDFAARQVKISGEEIRLTPTEYSLLRVLVQNAGKVVTHRQLLRTVWGEKAESQAQYLRVYVTHLRKKLEPNENAPRLIRTEVGIGYRLSTEQ
jgi:two-component system KDP operon response regulator KdpE